MRTAGNVPHPIPYQGSKRWLASTICGCIPKDVRTFYEPFAGSAAVSLCAATCLSARHFVIGDLHQPIASLWKAIIDAPHDLADDYERLWNEQERVGRTHFNEVRSAFNTSPKPALFLYLLARCVKAAIRYNRNGEFNNTADHRRRGARPETMRENIVRAAKILDGKTRIHNAHYLDTLKDAGDNDVVYLDPPYQGTSGDRDNRYVKGLSFDEFCEGLHQLVMRDLSLIISYDGRIGDKVYGQRLPASLKLRLFEVKAGRSTQETLLGRDGVTYESLYVSESLLDRVPRLPRLLLEPAKASEERLLFQ
ncbi:MAG: DNA adenine methylase [Planctomycetes bacterium]|nr:DNA adenine methylase [Planctomycetota bacterium]